MEERTKLRVNKKYNPEKELLKLFENPLDYNNTSITNKIKFEIVNSLVGLINQVMNENRKEVKVRIAKKNKS